MSWDQLLKDTKNRKEKYGGILFSSQNLHVLYICWKQSKLSDT